MSKVTVTQRIQDSMEQIFTFSLKRCNQRQEAEDLTQEIMYQLIKSSDTLQNEDAYYGWMWQVANNVYNSSLRKKYKLKNEIDSESVGEIFNEQTSAVELSLEDAEDLETLYRELSLLSKNYRETLCEYYMKGKSCKKIAAQLEVSEESVKQYLFKSRKRLKEGMAQVRTVGERSFNPRKFFISFYGKGHNQGYELFKRKAPGNILLECYYSPMTIEALSLELGIAAPYLEDDLNLLIEHDLLTAVKGEKYMANLVIFTEVFEEEFQEKCGHCLKTMANQMVQFFTTHMNPIQEIFDPEGRVSTQALKWRFVSYSLYHMLIECFLSSQTKHSPELFNGMTGYRWGLEKTYGDNPFDFGILGHKTESGQFAMLMNFAVLQNRHRSLVEKETAALLLDIGLNAKTEFEPLEQAMLSDLVARGIVRTIEPQAPEASGTQQVSYAVNCPVLSADLVKTFKNLLTPLTDDFLKQTQQLAVETEKQLKNHVPEPLQNNTTAIAAIKQVEGTIVSVMNELDRLGWLELPTDSDEVLNVFLL